MSTSKIISGLAAALVLVAVVGCQSSPAETQREDELFPRAVQSLDELRGRLSLKEDLDGLWTGELKLERTQADVELDESDPATVRILLAVSHPSASLYFPAEGGGWRRHGEVELSTEGANLIGFNSHSGTDPRCEWNETQSITGTKTAEGDLLVGKVRVVNNFECGEIYDGIFLQLHSGTLSRG